MLTVGVLGAWRTRAGRELDLTARAACLPHRSQRRSGPMLPPQPAWRVSRGGPPGVG